MSFARSSTGTRLGVGGALLLYGLLAGGCATHTLNSARHNFYAGRLDQAEDTLSSARIPNRDRVLFLMERGMVRQMRGEYADSSQDFIEAHDILRELETYSLSRGTGSLVINDTIRNFVGYPYERTLLHAYTAKNHMAEGRWNDAGVEARRIIYSLSEDTRRKHPDEPYSRYVSALILELTDDASNAEMQYRLVDEQLASVQVDPRTGRLKEAPPEIHNETDHDRNNRSIREDNPSHPVEYWGHELVVFIQLGRSARPLQRDRNSTPLYAEIHIDGEVLGRSHTLSDTTALTRQSEEARAAIQAAKEVGRFVIKETIAIAVESQHDHVAGDLTRLVLFGLLERPDNRRWETLPRWLQVARVPAPETVDSYDLVLKNSRGETVRTITVHQPINRYRNTHISFFRDQPLSTITQTPDSGRK